MRDRGGCTECFRVWFACACPNRCPECGAGFRDNSSCGTAHCRAGQMRRWDLQAKWERQDEAEAVEPVPEIECQAVPDPSPMPCPAPPANASQAGKPDGTVLDGGVSISAGSRRAGARSNAEKRASVLVLLSEGLANREIARRAGVSPQTVGNIRRTVR